MNQINPGTAILLPIITSILVNSIFLGSLLNPYHKSKNLTIQYECIDSINNPNHLEIIIPFIIDNSNLKNNTYTNFSNLLPASPVCLEENNIYRK